MNKNELDYKKALLGASKFTEGAKTLRHLGSVVGYVFAIWLVFEGIQKVVGDQSPDGISAIAKIVDALNLGSILGYAWGIGASVAWMRERKGKQRIIREKNKLQKKSEETDSYRPSSGLTDVGGTPVQEVE